MNVLTKPEAALPYLFDPPDTSYSPYHCEHCRRTTPLRTDWLDEWRRCPRCGHANWEKQPVQFIPGTYEPAAVE